MASFVRGSGVRTVMELVHEMQGKGIGHDNVTHDILFLGLKRADGF